LSLHLDGTIVVERQAGRCETRFIWGPAGTGTGTGWLSTGLARLAFLLRIVVPRSPAARSASMWGFCVPLACGEESASETFVHGAAGGVVSTSWHRRGHRLVAPMGHGRVPPKPCGPVGCMLPETEVRRYITCE
jgi:hypothetical protein